MLPSSMEASPITWEQTLKYGVFGFVGSVTYSDFDHIGPDLREKLQRAASSQLVFRFTSNTGAGYDANVEFIGADRRSQTTNPVTEPETGSALMIASIGLGLLAMATKRRLSS